MYTTNNAWLLFKENQVGSLEPGKFADFVVVDTDVMNCPAGQIEEGEGAADVLGGEGGVRAEVSAPVVRAGCAGREFREPRQRTSSSRCRAGRTLP